MKKFLIPVFTAFVHVSSAQEIDPALLGIFKPLSKLAENKDNPLTESKIALGHQLYFEPRLSLDHQVSCNTCHDLNSYGDDGRATSLGIGGQKGGRNAPTVLNAAIHLSQFWDGRAKDVEEQATGPILNPIEMGMPSSEFILEVLGSMPEYVGLFEKAFPGEEEALTLTNVGRAIGAFERTLLTPSRFDQFLEGKKEALSIKEKRGLNTFVTKGCATCHNGMGVGGHMYQKLGLLKPWPTEDKGRANLEGHENMEGFFKVPSLRNCTETAPYLHDGSLQTLEETIKMMAEYQTTQTLNDEEISDIIAFLGSLRGEVNPEHANAPSLPASTDRTPKPRQVTATSPRSSGHSK
jgi:cytochrome c peroxidase